MIVSHFSYFIILLLIGGGDVIETLGGYKTPVLKFVLCTCFTDPRFIAFIHFGPIYMFVRFAVHLYICYFVKVSNQKSDLKLNIQLGFSTVVSENGASSFIVHHMSALSSPLAEYYLRPVLQFPGPPVTSIKYNNTIVIIWVAES